MFKKARALERSLATTHYQSGHFVVDQNFKNPPVDTVTERNLTNVISPGLQILATRKLVVR